MGRMIGDLLDYTRTRLGAGMPSDGRDFALVGVVGDSTPARIAYGNDAGGARLTLPAGDGVWGHGRSELELVAETGTAAKGRPSPVLIFFTKSAASS